MAFLIFTTDRPDTGHIRAAHRAAHYAYLKRYATHLIASGGLQDDAGETFIGAAILVDFETRAQVEAFVAEDPFTAADLFQEVRIHRWKKAFFDGRPMV